MSTKGAGAFLNGEKISVSDRDMAHSCFCTSLSCYRKERGENCAKILNRVFQEAEDFRRFGAAVIELTALAAGRVELYYEPALAPWDHGASRLIIEEAGGILDNVYPSGITYERQMAVIAANNRELLRQMSCRTRTGPIPGSSISTRKSQGKGLLSSLPGKDMSQR